MQSGGHRKKELLFDGPVRTTQRKTAFAAFDWVNEHPDRMVQSKFQKINVEILNLKY